VNIQFPLYPHFLHEVIIVMNLYPIYPSCSNSADFSITAPLKSQTGHVIETFKWYTNITLSMEEFIPDPKHIDEWNRWYSIYNSSGNEQLEYRARCILGLITGKTLDFGASIE